MPQEVPPEGRPEEENPASAPEGSRLLRLEYQPQEIPLTAPESRCTFRTVPDTQLLVTPAAVEQFGMEVILASFYRLQYLARLHNGLDYLQVFENPETRDELWFIEDAPGVVTALLPDER